jgi:hypothetical protein
VKLTAEATDTEARRELWVSFRGLLQSYLAAATIGTSVPPVILTNTEPGALQIAGLAHTVRLELEPDTGEGYWAVSKAPVSEAGSGAEPEILDEGAFRLHLNAQFDWTGKPGPLEMDAVAEALATLVLS